MKGTVCALFVAFEKKSRPAACDAVEVTATGFAKDFHAGMRQRQILMISDQVLQEFDLKPGDLFEQMVIGGLDVMAFSEGQQVHVGDVVLEVTIPCEPCVQMDRIRPGLKKALDGKRGMFAKVIAAGTIKVGDAVNC